jgi:hypothetical protein
VVTCHHEDSEDTSSLLLSDPSTPKTQSIKESSSVKLQDKVEEKGLHQDGDLHQTDSPGLRGTSSREDAQLLNPSPSQKFEVIL